LKILDIAIKSHVFLEFDRKKMAAKTNLLFNQYLLYNTISLPII